MNVSRSQHRAVDQGAWEKHFEHMANSSTGVKDIYKVKTADKAAVPLSESVRLVSETAATVARAQGQVTAEEKALRLEPQVKDSKVRRRPPMKRSTKRVADAVYDDIFDDV